jgi:ParB-like chromosome segregation protein Spo0J
MKQIEDRTMPHIPHDTSIIELIPIERILPNEEHDEARLLEVLDSMTRSGRWTVPIVLERASLAVMDGHHRLAAARRLSLPRVPCVLLDYAQVDVQARRPEFRVDAAHIVARSLARNLYPPKTTRHIFLQPLPACSIEIATLAALAV